LKRLAGKRVTPRTHAQRGSFDEVPKRPWKLSFRTRKQRHHELLTAFAQRLRDPPLQEDVAALDPPGQRSAYHVMMGEVLQEYLNGNYKPRPPHAPSTKFRDEFLAGAYWALRRTIESASAVEDLISAEFKRRNVDIKADIARQSGRRRAEAERLIEETRREHLDGDMGPEADRILAAWFIDSVAEICGQK
jgi:hypothetical protein